MKKALTVVLVLVAFVVTGASMLAAQEKEVKVTVTAPAAEAKACAKQMQLTDEQKSSIEKMRRECSLKGEELRADLMKLRVEMKREMGADAPSLSAIEATVKKMSAVREKMQMNRISCMLEMRKILGPDWRKHCGGMEEGASCMMGAGGDDPENIDVMIETGDDSPMREMRVMRREGASGGGMGCCPMMPGRGEALPGMKKVMRVREAGPGMGGCPMMSGGAGHACSSECASSGMPGKMMIMKKGASGQACAGACGGSCGGHRSSWEKRMFRPHGKKAAHGCSGDCKQAEAGCKMMMKP